MDKLTLTMLRVFCDQPAMLMIDGAAAGRVGKDGLALPVSGKELLIQLFPLRSGYFPITRMACFDPPSLAEPDGHAALCVLPDGVFELHIRFQAPSAPEKLPYILHTLPFTAASRTFSATVYFDRSFGFVIEEGGRVIFSCGFSHALSSAKLHLRQLGGRQLIIAEGFFEGGEELYFAEAGPEPRLLLSRTAVSFRMDENEIEMESLTDGARIREVFTLSGGADIGSSSVFPADSSPLGLFYALLYAVKNRREELAMSLLAPSLKNDVDFSDLCEFFGDMHSIHPYSGGAALRYEGGNGVYRVRVFGFTVKNEKIVNITEE